MLALVACLALVPLAQAHASLGNPSRTEGASLAVEAVPMPEAKRAQAQPEQAVPARRSVMVESGPRQKPVMRLSAMYRVMGRDEAGKDNCLKGTGTRLKRDPNGPDACTIGNGQAFSPER